MNRFSFPPRLLLLLMTLNLGQVASFGQYYPPAATVSGLDGNPVVLSGGGGSYSGGYYTTYSYTTTTDTGYWDYTSYGHWGTQDQGYWDNTTGQWQDQGNWDNTTGYTDGSGNWVSQPTWNSNWVWVSQPTWVANNVPMWVYDPTWIDQGNTTMTQQGQAWVSVSLGISGSGSVSLSAYNNGTGNTDYWNGNYDFNGNFSGALPSISPINIDNSSWTPPSPPPTIASFGPPSIWVEGTRYSWDHSDFDDTGRTTGKDYYTDGASHVVWFQSSSSGTNSTGGQTPSWNNWNGNYINGVFEGTGGVDVRAADAGGNVIYATAPSNLPPAVRVDGNSTLWQYLGQGANYYHYAGSTVDQRLTVNVTDSTILLPGDSSSTAFYSNGTIWAPPGGRDIRAVSLDGSLWQSNAQPSWGPPDVWVNGAVWRYAGTWNGSITSPISPGPVTGDYYLGDNGGQSLLVDGSNNVTVSFGSNTSPITGTYAAQSNEPNAPRVFTVNSSNSIYPGDVQGVYHSAQPVVGPPAVWVNGITFPFGGSNEDASQQGNWVDTYVDGSNNFILLTSTDVRGFLANGNLNWSGSFVPADSNLGDGGIFIVTNGSPRFDVRASGGVTLLPPQGSPHNGHPIVVKVDGKVWNFAGSTTDTDYYFGANIGERLWIDSTGAVSFTNTVKSPNLAGSGFFSGTVFLVQQHDLRACTSDALPVTPFDSPEWGPAALWVEGVVWPFLGSVSDDTLQVHADYYGGSNAGQVVCVNSLMQVSGAYTGVFNGGVFVVEGGADLRALDDIGAQIAPIGNPVNGFGNSLRIGGLHWNFIGTSSGMDYYATPLGGQRLSINSSGAVVYSDHTHSVNNATGTYANGVFTSTGGGTSFNAGTIVSDLDILGNIISFGTLADNAATAGVTLQFQDTYNSMDQSHTASLFTSLARPQAQWKWSRAADSSGLTLQPVMQLDSSNKLTLYDAAGNLSMLLDATPDGQSAIKGVLRVRPGGDLPMATEFQQGTQP